MKPAVFRLRFWHRYLGLVAILPLLLVSLSGMLLVYKKPLIQLLVTQQAELPKEYSLAHIAKQLDDIAQLAQTQGAVRIKAPNRQEPYWTITDSEQSHQLFAIDTLAPYQTNLWLLKTLEFVHHLHTELLLNKTGQTILLISAILSLLLLIAGIWLWWPGRRGFRWRFIKPWPIKLKMVLQFHRHSGIVAAPILAIILLTATIMMWQKQIAPLLPTLPSHTIAQTEASTQPLSAKQAMRLAQSQLPDSWPTYIRLPEGENDTYRFRYRLPGEWHPNGRTSVNVDPHTGKMELTQRADQLPWQYQLINQIYPLHSGYGINGLYQLLILLGGWSLAWISLTGLLSYLKQEGWLTSNNRQLK
ncbi:PepSY domain-containing protein [Shewanella sp. AS1]|uniref:PepSY-associated TM helix domain-containing protein n=1 Tax=Shewanella sp. AS1 TaxID=2907626 RepID=UPI001F2FEE76|nr:PepSY-associated TM helix domain-containing protein [Shewanella sp. AS1]MCE9680236.1 PepSY domain-containing protein [Shewanella sp. AS1]